MAILRILTSLNSKTNMLEACVFSIDAIDMLKCKYIPKLNKNIEKDKTKSKNEIEGVELTLNTGITHFVDMTKPVIFIIIDDNGDIKLKTKSPEILSIAYMQYKGEGVCQPMADDFEI